MWFLPSSRVSKLQVFRLDAKERWCERKSITGVYTNGLCISRLLSDNLFHVKRENCRQILQGHWGPSKKSGKIGSIARSCPKVWTSRAQSLRAKIRRKITWGILAPRKMRPQSCMGFSENIYKLKNVDKDTRYTPIEARVVPASNFDKTRGARFLSKSGAPVHMASKQELSSDELDILQRSRTPLWCLQPVGTVQSLEETRAVLSLGKLCDDHGYSCEWVSGKKPQLTKEGKTSECKTDNFALLVIPGLSTNSGSNSSSTSTLQDLSSTSPAQERCDGLVLGDWCGSLQKPKTKIKRGMTLEIRTTVCEIFLNGWRNSQTI